MKNIRQKFKPLILASQSLIRKEILEKAGLTFSCHSPKESTEKEAKEKLSYMSFSSKEASLFLARSKAGCFKVSSDYIVASDQLCESPYNSWLNKPSSRKEAFDQLVLLSGKTHYLYTAAVLYHKGCELWSTVQKVKLTMKSLKEDYIETYLQKIPDKQLFSSGIYCIEKEGAALFDKIEGDYFAALGFPLLPFLTFIKNTDKT